jgi:hypothetical protein
MKGNNMKFSANTFSVLKNFSSINPSVMLRAGNVLKTISPQKTVMAVATLDQDFEGTAGIYDLSRFLSTISLFQEPDIIFGDNKFAIKDSKSRVNYTYAAESMILSPPDKDIVMNSVDVDVDISWVDFDKVMKAASVLKLPNIAFIGTDEGITLAAIDSNNPSADTYDIIVNDTPQKNKYRLIFRSENLKLIPNDYNVKISGKGISKFTSDVVTYYIAVETNSTTS